MIILIFSSVIALCSAVLPEENLDVPALVKYWGYPIETHRLLTEDGYFLTLHRIPYGNPKYDYNASNYKAKPVVFLQHGLLCSSSNWVTNLPRQSLGFIMADAGYDVWMGNVRGNTYSNEHIEHKLNSDAYWDFSFDEMAQYDLPAMVNYALKTSNQKQLYYVAHSQGTMMAFAGLSQNKKLREQIRVVYALAPVARLGNTQSPIRYLSYFEKGFEFTFEMLGIRDFLPSSSWIKFLAEKACPKGESICDNVMFVIAGYDQSNFNESRTPVYFTHTPAGTSVKNMLHFCQLIKDAKFQRYDYGYFINLYQYGWFQPTTYDLTTFDTPVALLSGSNDWLADRDDVDWLANQLKNVLVYKKIDGYNHLDFIWGISARDLAYKHILKSIAKYNR